MNYEEAVKSLKNAIPTASKELLTSGKLNISKLTPIIEKEKLRTEANKKVIEEINKFSSKNKAQNTATMVAAYDEKTGKIVVGKSVGEEIKLEMLDKRTVDFLKLKLGKDIEIGSKTKLCDNFVGGCGEVLAADQLIRDGVNPLDIKISQVYRPRNVYNKDITNLPESAFVDTCANCVEVFKK
ncbi:TPA: hypothetical protein ACKRTE_001852 [Providencia rettgeri]